MPQKHRSPDYVDLQRPTIFAHRGASAYSPENTLAAFEQAAQQGADGIELDAKLSADDHVVIMHDDTVDRTTNGCGRVGSMTLSELKQLDAGSKFPPGFSSQKIPTLEEVFEQLGGKLLINVELTNYTSPIDNLPEKVISLVKKHGLEQSCLLSSFNFLALIRARSLMPKIPMGYLTRPGEAHAALHTRLIRFGPLLALHPAYIDATPQILQFAHQAKCHVHAYTVDQPETMKQLFRAGIDGIFTNDPALARNILEGKQASNP